MNKQHFIVSIEGEAVNALIEPTLATRPFVWMEVKSGFENVVLHDVTAILSKSNGETVSFLLGDLSFDEFFNLEAMSYSMEILAVEVAFKLNGESYLTQQLRSPKNLIYVVIAIFPGSNGGIGTLGFGSPYEL